MSRKKFFNRYSILMSALFIGLALALALPWLADIQGIAASPDTASGVENNLDAVNIIYVAKTGDGSAATIGWSTAFTNVQDALDTAAILGNSEIWVAAGVYYPDEGKSQIDNVVTSTFVITDNIALYGGFDISDTHKSERDWVNNVTVLSGDIDGDDPADANGVVTDTSNINGKNAFNVVTARGVSGTAVLDGFTVTAGYASGTSPFNDKGGGLLCDGISSLCSPSLKNLIFSANYAKSSGGGMTNLGTQSGISSPSLENVSFINNYAIQGGGAMFNNAANGGNSSPLLNKVAFIGNSTGIPFNQFTNGGAMLNQGISSGISSPSLTNVIFSGNSATRDGGAMYNLSISNGTSSPSLTNVLFSGNSAGLDGGAVFNAGPSGGTSSPKLMNVTFSGNLAARFGGAINNSGSDITMTPEVSNSIFWNNQDSSGADTISATIVNKTTLITITHSLVQSAGASGTGIWLSDPSFVDGGNNIDQEPLFVLPVDPSTAPTTTGDLRLQSGSPAIDMGNNDFITGVDTDLDGNNRIMGAHVDMGAYEYQIPYKYDRYLPFIYR